MGLNYKKLRACTARQIIAALGRDGFVLDRQVGAHQHYLHSDGRRVTVSFHGAGSTFPPKTLKRMIEDQAKWTEADVKRLGLVK